MEAPTPPNRSFGLVSAAQWWSRATVDDFGNEVGPGWPEIRLAKVTSDSEVTHQLEPESKNGST